MTAEQFQIIEKEGGCVDLSARAKFRLTGGDRVRYLNGQVTNDVRKATSGTALQACVTNAKGRIEAEVFLHVSQKGGQALWLDAEPGQRETLAARLERYIVADDVELADVSDEWSLWHVFGPAAEALLRTAGAEGVLHARRLGAPGVDVWLPHASSIPALPGPVLNAEEAESLRILRGIPSWPQELNGDAFPQEAGLEATAMDFSKGCYIGQEVLSRIKTTGKMPRMLRRFVAEAGSEAGPGLRLLDASQNEAGVVEAGVVTSAARHPVLDRWAGLAYVRQPFAAVDSLLLAGEDPPRILGKIEFPLP